MLSCVRDHMQPSLASRMLFVDTLECVRMSAASQHVVLGRRVGLAPQQAHVPPSHAAVLMCSDTKPRQEVPVGELSRSEYMESQGGVVVLLPQCPCIRLYYSKGLQRFRQCCGMHFQVGILPGEVQGVIGGELHTPLSGCVLTFWVACFNDARMASHTAFLVVSISWFSTAFVKSIFFSRRKVVMCSRIFGMNARF
jgi:hypothetical protein